MYSSNYLYLMDTETGNNELLLYSSDMTAQDIG